MGVSTCIQDNSVYIKTGLLNLVYQLSLDVRLEIVYLYISILLTKFDKVIFKIFYTFVPELYLRSNSVRSPYLLRSKSVTAPYQVRSKSKPIDTEQIRGRYGSDTFRKTLKFREQR